jgi:hypothetical protein
LFAACVCGSGAAWQGALPLPLVLLPPPLLLCLAGRLRLLYLLLALPKMLRHCTALAATGAEDLLGEAIHAAHQQHLVRPNAYVVCIMSHRGSMVVKVVQVGCGRVGCWAVGCEGLFRLAAPWWPRWCRWVWGAAGGLAGCGLEAVGAVRVGGWGLLVGCVLVCLVIFCLVVEEGEGWQWPVLGNCKQGPGPAE